VVTGIELSIIAAVVVGGTSVMGGQGSTLGAIVGAVVIGVILNGMALLAVPGTFQDAVLGAAILLAISMDVVRRKLVSGLT
jgi:ABC-type xylose transport system permease subunit